MWHLKCSIMSIFIPKRAVNVTTSIFVQLNTFQYNCQYYWFVDSDSSEWKVTMATSLANLMKQKKLNFVIWLSIFLLIKLLWRGCQFSLPLPQVDSSKETRHSNEHWVPFLYHKLNFNKKIINISMKTRQGTFSPFL